VSTHDIFYIISLHYVNSSNRPVENKKVEGGNGQGKGFIYDNFAWILT
jgi:hypothetical protein